MELTEIEKLVVMRKRLKLTQHTVAKALDITQGYLSVYETGAYIFNKRLADQYKNYIENYTKCEDN